MKIQKGQPGYIKAQKQKLLLFTIMEFAIVVALLLLGYFQTGTKLNLLTAVAVLGCLPASKMLVEFIAIASYKAVDPEKYMETEEKAALLTTAYDMVITSKEKIMPVDAVVISGNTVCGYASNPKTDVAKVAQHLKETLHQNRLDKVTVKIFSDYAAFIARAEGMNNMAAIDRPDTQKLEQKIRGTILSTSM